MRSILYPTHYQRLNRRWRMSYHSRMSKIKMRLKIQTGHHLCEISLVKMWNSLMDHHRDRGTSSSHPPNFSKTSYTLRSKRSQIPFNLAATFTHDLTGIYQFFSMCTSSLLLYSTVPLWLSDPSSQSWVQQGRLGTEVAKLWFALLFLSASFYLHICWNTYCN